MFFKSVCGHVSRRTGLQDNKLSLSTNKSHQIVYSHDVVFKYRVYESPKSGSKSM